MHGDAEPQELIQALLVALLLDEVGDEVDALELYNPLFGVCTH
jgi:hypothetical protein